MKKTKRWISLMLALLICFPYVSPLSVWAVETEEEANSASTDVNIVVVKPAETKPEESKPAETKPEDLKPAGTKPVETKPEESKPAEPKPEETKPEEPKPEETKPEEPKPEEPKPEEPKPEEPKPEELKPEEPKPEEPKPEETKPEEPKPEEPKSEEPKPEEPKPEEPKPEETKPEEPKPEEPKPEEPKPEETKPEEPKPEEPKPEEPKPEETKPEESKPAATAPTGTGSSEKKDAEPTEKTDEPEVPLDGETETPPEEPKKDPAAEPEDESEDESEAEVAPGTDPAVEPEDKTEDEPEDGVEKEDDEAEPADTDTDKDEPADTSAIVARRSSLKNVASSVMRGPAAPLGAGSGEEDGDADNGLELHGPEEGIVILPTGETQSPEITYDIGDPDKTDTGMDLPRGYSVFMDENGTYRVTYTIAEGASEEELTLDLRKAFDVLASYMGSAAGNIIQPGDSREFEIWIQSESGHTYKYKEGSFALTTPTMDPADLPDDPEDYVEGFDGQIIAQQYMGTTKTTVTTRLPALRQALIDAGIPAYDIDHNMISSYDLNRFKRNNPPEKIEQIILEYYSNLDGKTYTSMQQLTEESASAVRDIMQYTYGRDVASIDGVSPAMQYDYTHKNTYRFVYGEDLVKEAAGDPVTVQVEVRTVYDIIDYEDEEHPVPYYDVAPATALSSSILRTIRRNNLPDDTLVYVSPEGWYSFGFVTADGEIATASNSQEFAKTYVTPATEYENSAWAQSDNPLIRDATIAEYMRGENSEIWRNTDQYFQDLTGSGINSDDATWISLMMGINDDIFLAGNFQQGSAWSYENHIKLERVDGEVTVTKKDGATKETITDDETSFQLWYYKNNDTTQKYCYTTYKDEKTGDTTQGFVRYDADNKSLTYTIDTTGGELHIDYALLEGMIYYLQEAVAPEGYELDTTVYILCDDEDTAKAAQALLKKDASVKTSGTRYAGRVDSTKPLNIEVINVRATTPPPTPPTPDVPPANPGKDIPDEDVPLPGSGFINMNEGDCFN